MRKNIPQFLAPFCLSLERSAGAVIFCERDGRREYLLIQYPHGHWEFARGHVEEGETDEQAALREVEEETNLKDLAIVKDFSTTFSFWYAAHGDELSKRMKARSGVVIYKKVIFFLARVQCSDVTISHEHHNFLWLPFDKAVEKLTYENAQKVLTKAEAMISKKSS